MTNLAIRLENLSKRYCLDQRNPSSALHEFIDDIIRSPLRQFNPKKQVKTQNNYIWALKDVSFEVNQGEVVAIMGHNGAGKSVLLKILSRITKPTEGYVEIHGRVGSMIEAGASFHPELTGRENIYLNGIILGMKRGEINGKFDEIVSFAEIEAFLDTPVKHYSSGMKGRLGFAITAHLEPEILIIDEVLAVEDVAFQEKSFLKIKEIVQSGRTVLFVSHNMKAVAKICDRAILLNQGRVILQGKTDTVLSHYESYKTNLKNLEN
ncbi:hypothetical protein C7H19_13595 [Aphanothece hegewaldii CCALA 016]|uniref:ABC transporter domain-containing protein n=1 Tax=Aphanothece hegewaldii CCALA 016 TaxID=2107694 RepID=A0A2T1LWF3_9CHRO|nr:ABC transporter ATP-binding protein [Aphanothece hegewaldii]PSF36237.1 hypothetical protein C7H19_13595 [Aphanothece hegewaldii CCALA 016]